MVEAFYWFANENGRSGFGKHGKRKASSNFLNVMFLFWRSAYNLMAGKAILTSDALIGGRRITRLNSR